MATNKKKISGYVSPDLFDKFLAWKEEQGFTSASQALSFLLERFSAQGGFSVVSLADRVKILEEKIGKLAPHLSIEFGSENQASDTPNKLKQKDLAKRLNTTESTLNKRRNRDNFYEWTRDLDPNGLGWEYDEEGKIYIPKLYSRSTTN